MNIGIIIVIVLIGIWGLGIFLGAIGGLSKAFKYIPKTEDTTDMKSQEQQSIDDTKDKEQKMMDDMKQKMEDSQQKF